MKLLGIINENNILIPRKIEDREKNHIRIINKKIQEYIKNGSKGDLYLHNTPITKLPDNLNKVGGNLHLSYSKIESLPDDLEVTWSLFLSDTNIKTLPKNLKVGGNIRLIRSNIKILPDDLYVGGNLYLTNTPNITKI